MNKKTIRICSFILMICMIISICIPSLASASVTKPGDVKPNTGAQGISNVVTIGNGVIGIIKVVGILLSVGVLTWIGVKYMMGSPEEKSDYKKSLMPYVVGAVLVFSASWFADTIYTWITNSTTT